MERYLVSGGAGFIGSHIAERLLREGNFVRVLDNFSFGKEENLSFVSRYSLPSTRYSLIRGDIRDSNTCQRACEGIDIVFHQAALRSVPKSLKNPADYNLVNINGTLNMLEAAKEKGVKRFIFASSSSIYGDTEHFPQKETDLPGLISPYALTKLAGEYYCRVYSQNYALSTVCLRYFNVFGPRQALDDEYAVVIPKFIHCLLNNQSPPIFGTGKQSRDFTYIDNVVQANILAAITSGASGQVFNIANGKDNTVLQLVDTLNKITGKSIKPQFKPVRAGDAFRTLADISKAEEFLGYKPGVDFSEGLARTVEWFKKNGAN
jgi:nucleoside-diphosphate-sugar epimerase